MRNAMATLEIPEAYPQDKYLPSFLARGRSEERVFHAQLATDVEGDNIRIVSMYTPDPNEWDEELRFRIWLPEPAALNSDAPPATR